MNLSLLSKRVVSALLLSAAGLLMAPAGAVAGNMDATDHHAWSENGGWIRFAPTHGGVTVFTDHLEGEAWAENIGWIKLGSHSGGASHTYANSSNTDWGVNNDGAGNLSGYAWSETVGWINFNPAHGQVTIDPASGDFDGYAWAENLGWIHFKNASPAYKVRRAAGGITVSAVSGNTTEAGGTATFTVVLERQPAADVVIAVASSDTGEGSVSPATLTFTSGDWSSAQSVTVTGVDDSSDDGDQGFTILLAAATSLDAGYDGVDPADVSVTNVDNDDPAPAPAPAPAVPNNVIYGSRTITGNLRNPTIMAGAHLRGGQLSGTITNRGTISDTTILEDGVVTGGSMGGATDNRGILNGVTILSGGVVTGGTLAGSITNGGTLRGVTLARGAVVEGGTVSGSVSGATTSTRSTASPAGADGLAMVNATIDADASLSDLLIGAGAEVNPAAQLGRGVRFADNRTIPAGIDLTATFAPLGDGLLYAAPALDLGGDVVLGGDSIVDQVNGLDGLGDAGNFVTQDSVTGFMALSVGEVRYALRPTAIGQAGDRAALGVRQAEDGSFVLVTASGREIVAWPVVQAPSAFIDSLGLLGLEAPAGVAEARIEMVFASGSRLLSVPAPYATLTGDEEPLGFRVVEHPEVVGVTRAINVFEHQGRRYRQELFSAPFDRGALREGLLAVAGVDSALVGADGVITVNLDGEVFRVLIGRRVVEGESRGAAWALFEPVDDLNGDGVDDFTAIYPDGSRQSMYLLPPRE